MKRLFLAFELPQYFKEILITCRNLLKTNESVRWVPIENLHITLYFIGNFDVLLLAKLLNDLSLVLKKPESI